MKPKASKAVDNAILTAGQLAGMSFRLDADALEKWLDTNPEDFKYKKLCRAAIAFKRAVEQS